MTALLGLHSEDSCRTRIEASCWLPAPHCLNGIELFSSQARRALGKLIMCHHCIRNINRIKHLKATVYLEGQVAGVICVCSCLCKHSRQNTSRSKQGFATCLLIKAKGLAVEKKMDWKKDGHFQVAQSGNCRVGQEWSCTSVGMSVTLSPLLLVCLTDC